MGLVTAVDASKCHKTQSTLVTLINLPPRVIRTHAREDLDDTSNDARQLTIMNLSATFSPRENVTVAIVQPNQASSAQGIELFEDLLWDLAALSFVPHVFQPSLTFFPASATDGEDPNGAKEAATATGVQSEATVCAQLVSVVTVVCLKNLPFPSVLDASEYDLYSSSLPPPPPPRDFHPPAHRSVAICRNVRLQHIYICIVCVSSPHHTARSYSCTHIHMRTRKPCLCL